MEELRREAGRQFDPQLVAALSGLLERHPAIHHETSGS
jgi:HD-GYP domain-containing protein (c-di-GMP phosphodiesterase class II)